MYDYLTVPYIDDVLVEFAMGLSKIIYTGIQYACQKHCIPYFRVFVVVNSETMKR